MSIVSYIPSRAPQAASRAGGRQMWTVRARSLGALYLAGRRIQHRQASRSLPNGGAGRGGAARRPPLRQTGRVRAHALACPCVHIGEPVRPCASHACARAPAGVHAPAGAAYRARRSGGRQARPSLRESEEGAASSSGPSTGHVPRVHMSTCRACALGTCCTCTSSRAERAPWARGPRA